MNDLDRYRAMESLCRQSAVFHPDESWRLLADAEMWHHKAEAVAFRLSERSGFRPADTVIQAAYLPDARDGNRLLLSR
jgi:hypothetical protein